MKSTKSIVRVFTVILAVVMIAASVGCISSYNSNPVVMKVGSVDIDFNRFYTLFNNSDTSSNPYYTYFKNGYISAEQYTNYIIQDLTNYGVQMDQIKIQNITLDETEEAELQQEVDKNIADYAVSTYGSKIDSSITDEAAKAAAAIDLLKQELKDNNATFDAYRKNIEDSLRNNKLIEKLRKNAVGDVAATIDDMKKYYEDNAKTTTVSAFKSAYDSFINNQTKSVPLLMPHPENAVEDNPDTADKDESREANPYGSFFSVQHVLIKFTNEAKDDDAKDLAAYAAADEEFMTKTAAFEEIIPTLDTDQFIEKCHDKDLCEDPGMMMPAYQFFGYLMQEELIDSYYDGFGYTAMKLKFGDEWEPKADESTESSEASKDEEATDYGVQFFTLTDGTRVGKVYTGVGAHYIIVSNIDCYCMFDENGYFMLPLYDGDNLVTDSEGIVTANGHMTQEQFDAVNAALALITQKEAASEETEESAETKENETTEEETEVLDLKAIYDYFYELKSESMESEKYATIFSEWKDKTNITVYKSILQSFYNLG